MVHLGEVGPVVWDQIMDEMEKKLVDINFKRAEVQPDWRKLAHRRKFEREAFAKYGYFKDFVLHPKVQMVKHYVDENAHFDNIMSGEPLISPTNGLILLFMVSRRLDMSITMLLAAFLFNLNPVYVSMAIVGMMFMKTSRKPKGALPRRRSPADTSNYRARPLHTMDKSYLEKDPYDHVLIGGDLGTFYTAALLSKCGHRCLVLQPSNTPALQIHPAGAPCATPVVQGVVSKIERYQPLLDAVQSQDPKKRVVFAPLGTATDGFTNAIVHLQTPAQSLEDALGNIYQRRAFSTTVQSRPGENFLVQFLCSTLSIEKSKIVGAFDRLRTLWQFITTYLFSRCVKASEWQPSPLAAHEGAKRFAELLQLPVHQYLYNCQIEDPKVLDTLHALACSIGANEHLAAHELSSFALGYALQVIESGAFVPIGGVEAIVLALTETIRSSGGDVVTHVDTLKLDVSELSNSSSNQSSPSVTYKAHGVSISSSSMNALADEITITAKQSVVSGLGVLGTYFGLASEIISDDTKEQLSSLQETSPRVKVVFWLQDSAVSLGVTSTSFYQVTTVVPTTVKQTDGGENARRLNRRSPSNGDVINKPPQNVFCHVWSPSAQDPHWAHPNTQVLIVEMDATAALARKIPLELYVASTETDGSHVQPRPGPRFVVDVHNDETNPNHLRFTEQLGRSLHLSKSKQAEFVRAAEIIVRNLYPAVKGTHIVHSHVECPVLGGLRLANDTAKFAAKLNANTEIQNFFLTGADLAGVGLSGELQGGWAAANAILGYNLSELGESRSVVQDLR